MGSNPREKEVCSSQQGCSSYPSLSYRGSTVPVSTGSFLTFACNALNMIQTKFELKQACMVKWKQSPCNIRRLVVKLKVHEAPPP